MDCTLTGNPSYRVISVIPVTVMSDMQLIEAVIRRLCQCDPSVQCDLLQTMTYARFKRQVLCSIKESVQPHEQAPGSVHFEVTCLLSHQISLHWSCHTCEVRYLLPCVKRLTAPDNSQHCSPLHDERTNLPKRRCVGSIQHT